MNQNIRITDSADSCLIEIEGTIGVPEAWQFDEPEERIATYEKFRATLGRIAAIAAPEIVVEIRSTGGDVNDALLIHDALKALPGRITTRCYGYTASAATLIAQAASEGCRELSANALYLIHNAVCAAEGNAEALTGALDLLRRTDERIAAVYAARSGRPAAEFETLMAENNGEGRWLSPEEAVAAGLADRLIATAKPETPPARSGIVGNLARGWRRLLREAGLQSDGPKETGVPEVSCARDEGSARNGKRTPPADRNVLHTDTDAQRLRREAIAEEARSRALPTAVLPCEDPSFGDSTPTANERAYAEDAKRLRGA